METLVVITTIELELVLWVAAISFFISLAATAIVSPNRQWFELVVIFAILFVINVVVVGLLVQGLGGMSMIEVEAIDRLERRFRG